MRLSPDEIIFWQHGCFKLNATIVFTWLVMAVLTASAGLITRRLSTGTELSRWQNLLEVLVTGIRDQIRGVSQQVHVPPDHELLIGVPEIDLDSPDPEFADALELRPPEPAIRHQVSRRLGDGIVRSAAVVPEEQTNILLGRMR